MLGVLYFLVDECLSVYPYLHNGRSCFISPELCTLWGFLLTSTLRNEGH